MWLEVWAPREEGEVGGVRLPYRLHQHVVLAIEQPGPGVLVQRLHVLAGAGGEPVLRRTAARVSLSDLRTKSRLGPWSGEVGVGAKDPEAPSCPQIALSLGPALCSWHLCKGQCREGSPGLAATT